VNYFLGCPTRCYFVCFLDGCIFILAVSLQNGYIFLMKSFDDVSPIQVHTGLCGPLCLEWSNCHELLAVAGTVQQTVPASTGTQQSSPDPKVASAPTVEYTNVLKFYSETGVLLYSTIIPYTQVCFRGQLFQF
jgi:hypothetical protein